MTVRYVASASRPRSVPVSRTRWSTADAEVRHGVPVGVIRYPGSSTSGRRTSSGLSWAGAPVNAGVSAVRRGCSAPQVVTVAGASRHPRRRRTGVSGAGVMAPARRCGCERPQASSARIHPAAPGSGRGSPRVLRAARTRRCFPLVGPPCSVATGGAGAARAPWPLPVPCSVAATGRGNSDMGGGVDFRAGCAVPIAMIWLSVRARPGQ